MAMHFLEKYGLMVLRVPSKFELLRFCKSTGATARASFGAPSPDELGFVKYLSVQEIGGANCCVLRQEASLGAISTIVLRGSTEGFLDDVERALNDGVNAFKALTRDGRCVAAGGATELELARQIGDWGKKLTGLEQYAVKAFAESFEVVPRTLAENSGLNATDVLSALYAAHAQGQINTGVDINGGPPKDLSQEGVVDLYATKWWALKLATDAAATVLRVDQIIMAKQAGGPKPRGMGGDDD
ncbi:chaperonin complex component [Haematococcus lacustris]|uniref:Chaperonin complex component n=1 Tax=Haematococcus lacustris TaxID=44745 RepID=A0A699YT33_HAELA|nr:chaperonin complex component [Haematococcus lacustris]